MEAIFLQSGIVGALVKETLGKFSDFAFKQICILHGVDERLKKLKRTLLKVQALVENVKSNQYWSRNNNNAVQTWLRDLVNVLYEADDFLDLLEIELRSTDPVDPHKVRKFVISKCKFCIPPRVVKLQRRLEAMAREMDGLFMNEVVRPTQPNFMTNVQTTSLIDRSGVVGRETDRDKIVAMLLSQGRDGENVSVIAIVGMAGVGKTTLAQLAYNDGDVIREFDFRIWVSVSVGYTVERITKSILESILGEEVRLSDLDPIQRNLQELIGRKEILVVLDNMWNVKASDWETLCMPFQVAVRSKILVTTRSMAVSRIVSRTTDAIYPVPLLKEEECWILMKQTMLLVEDRDDHRRMEEIGKKIAEKCGGLPLAAKVLRNILGSEFDERGWNAKLECKLWNLRESENDILSALELSHDPFSPFLRRCLAYCSIFPRNFRFKKDNLIQLWVAEGFIQPEGTKSPEDIGKEYFEDLISLFFFQESGDDRDNQSIYIMNDFIHGLAQLVSGEICFRMEHNISTSLPSFQTARHSSLLCNHIQPEVFRKNDRRRTFIVFCDGGCQVHKTSYSFLHNFCCIRVLNLSCANTTDLPNVFGVLKQLRYLDVSNTQIEQLPESITNVSGLQTLKLKNCRKFLHFPTNMKELKNLRHLDFDMNGSCSIAMPLELGELTKLQTLPIFIVGRENGQKIEELKNLGCLHGSLYITNLENVANGEEAGIAKLDEKPYLDKLELQWEQGRDADLQVIECLRPHHTIQQLIIRGYGGFDFPNWLSDSSFSRLESIYLEDCSSCIILHALGKLPLLKSLHLVKMSKLAFVDGAGHFPSLKTLQIEDMEMLQEWNGLEPGDMPKLDQLIIQRCRSLNHLLPINYFTSLEILEIEECPRLQSLPAEGLPNSLKSLIISNCNTLSQRCLVSEDWNGLPSISSVVIENEIIIG